MAFPVPLSRG
ncbi:hypothetical protein VCHC59B1_3431A, partial [Vibrio cholerae HC-59B1]